MLLPRDIGCLPKEAHVPLIVLLVLAVLTVGAVTMLFVVGLCQVAADSDRATNDAWVDHLTDRQAFGRADGLSGLFGR